MAGRPNAYRSVAELLAAPQLSSLLSASTALDAAAAGGATDPQASVSGASCNGNSSSTASAGHQGQRNKRLALVFGREVSGLTAAEVDMCDATLSIPIGRLQESLSLSHAVSVVLSRLFEARSAASSYHLPQSMGDLADGFQDSGVER
ncbi:hypothetical protein D9Q98_000643 [Chlorella vulgaris]|uniref:tRNA/rRNA methyltransferase SpoU type domain-containing protein n=1 Tax=Chlorella vulgaris TaxID=3077 RepID=A0A9D4Z2F0_CHLVU|nr:hypothetical protein D9Q98_000643 [Chlorella vulgaris]